MFSLLYKLEFVQLKILFIFVFLSLLLSGIFILISLLLAVQNPYFEKISAYECGFEPFEDARNQFEVRFYLVAILFIIFDIEIIYMLPWISSIFFVGIQSLYFMTLFFFLLIVGFLYEIIKGALDW